ncbi:hypothetical protein [Microbacterium hibisci]|uniref:hypothetical protein n=1 Tax=Microbacterium hibisci TaxID=2036000 RepID=UPI0019408E95|nr:hypothetical protein [Microbacterium hibisci]
MDAADRAELAALRRRAFGPLPDIDADPAALARLIALEDLARQEHAEAAAREHAVATGRAIAADAAAAGARAPAAGSPEPAERDAPLPRVGERDPHAGAGGDIRADDGLRHPSPSPDQRQPEPAAARRHGWLIGVAAAFVTLIGVGVWGSRLVTVESEAAPTPTSSPPAPRIEGREAYSFARDRDAQVLLEIPLDGAFGHDIGLPSERYVPSFPTSGDMDWATELGEYYGWDVWIAGATGVIQQEHCLLIERGSVARGRCVPAVLRENAALVVSVPAGLVPAAERPPGMDDDERLGFWWHADNRVTVMTGEAPPP